MTSPTHRPSPLRLTMLALLLPLWVAAAGCTIDIDASTSPVDTETRTFEHSFPVVPGETLQLANLMGEAELVAGSGDEVRIETTAHAAGRDEAQTQELLASLGWVRDGEGWALSYPVDDYTKYSYRRRPNFAWGSRTTTKYLGRRVTITSSGSGSVPTLFADLRIEMPDGADLKVRNVVGGVTGGELAGTLNVDTGSGDVTIESFRGDLVVDTGSGDVEVLRLNGSGNVDTGSGDVDLGELAGDGVVVDTGSGDVRFGPGRLRSLSVDTGSGDIEGRDFDAETMVFDTGSGDVFVSGPLDWARSVVADTGSGDVEIYGDAEASFRITADQGSGDLDVRYDGVSFIRDGRKIVGAERGDRHTVIEVDTGSGDCVLAPR